jgi:S1-C subfamily serine protease
MNDFPSTKGQQSSTGLALLSAVIGGLIVAAVFGALLATGVIGKSETVVRGGGVAAETANASGNAMTVGEIYKETSPGVVSIRVDVQTQSESPLGGQQEGIASGTGFVIDKNGYIVTNDHVVNGHKGDVKVTFSDDKTVNGKVIGEDPSSDVAVVKVDSDEHKLSPLTLGDSAKVAVGDPVVAIGNPFGLNQTATTGIISALQRTIDAPNSFQIKNVLQTDAAINPGNSGGPLLNDRGQVLGINSQIATSGSGGNTGIGFVVPINRVKEILPQLKKDGKVQYAFLGVTTQDVPSELAGKLKLGTDNGAVVVCVVNDGPADKAGLSAGGSNTVQSQGSSFNLDADIITRIDGNEVKNSTTVQTEVLKHKPGETVKIEFVRDGKKKSQDVKLGNRPNTTSNNCTTSLLDR